jgi:hypothetical protein
MLGISGTSYFEAVLVPVLPVPRWLVARDSDTIMDPETEPHSQAPFRTEHRGSLSLDSQVRKKTQEANAFGDPRWFNAGPVTPDTS